MSRSRYIAGTIFRMLTLLAAVSVLSFVLVTSSPIDPLTAYIGTNSTLSQKARDEITKHWGIGRSAGGKVHSLGGEFPQR